MKLIAYLLVLLSISYIVSAVRLDFDMSEREADAEDELVEKKEATQFLKRLFHPFSTKNEEIKRETREVYEEKCESIVPTQR